MNRRQFIRNGVGCIGQGCAESAFGIGVPRRTMTHVERVDAALQGKPVDRPPYTLYGNSQQAARPRVQAHDHLRFQREFNTDIVKVMNPYPYPAPRKPVLVQHQGGRFAVSRSTDCAATDWQRFKEPSLLYR
jgi:hypothetical protein